MILSRRRCKNLGSCNFLLKISNYLKVCAASFPRAQSTSLLTSALDSPQGVFKVSDCSGHGSVLVELVGSDILWLAAIAWDPRVLALKIIIASYFSSKMSSCGNRRELQFGAGQLWRTAVKSGQTKGRSGFIRF